MVPKDFEQGVMRRPLFRMMPKQSDEPKFLGYCWVCPSCKKEVRIIYYPVAVRTLFDSWFTDPVMKLKLTDADLLNPPAAMFACRECHGVADFSTCNPDAWNWVISYLSGGMLYGSEVEKPAEFRKERKRARTRQVHRAAPRREQVLRRVLNGWTTRQIALDLMMNIGDVRGRIRILCRQEGVANRGELARKLGSVHAQPPDLMEIARARRERMEKMMLEGLSGNEIMEREGISRQIYTHDAKMIYRKHGLRPFEGRSGLAKKFGIAFGKVNPVREEIKQRLMAGQRLAEIARAMGRSYRSVESYCGRICREEGVRKRKELVEKMNSVDSTQNSKVEKQAGRELRWGFVNAKWNTRVVLSG